MGLARFSVPVSFLAGAFLRALLPRSLRSGRAFAWFGFLSCVASLRRERLPALPPAAPALSVWGLRLSFCRRERLAAAWLAEPWRDALRARSVVRPGVAERAASLALLSRLPVFSGAGISWLPPNQPNRRDRMPPLVLLFALVAASVPPVAGVVSSACSRKGAGVEGTMRLTTGSSLWLSWPILRTGVSITAVSRS